MAWSKLFQKLTKKLPKSLSADIGFGDITKMSNDEIIASVDKMFGFEKSVQEDKLVAIHRLTSPSLIDVAKEGKLVGPSFHVSRAEKPPSSSFGQNIFVGNKNLVSPDKRQNKHIFDVYDAYSPMRPTKAQVKARPELFGGSDPQSTLEYMRKQPLSMNSRQPGKLTSIETARTRLTPDKFGITYNRALEAKNLNLVDVKDLEGLLVPKDLFIPEFEKITKKDVENALKLLKKRGLKKIIRIDKSYDEEYIGSVIKKEFPNANFSVVPGIPIPAGKDEDGNTKYTILPNPMLGLAVLKKAKNLIPLNGKFITGLTKIMKRENPGIINLQPEDVGAAIRKMYGTGDLTGEELNELINRLIPDAKSVDTIAEELALFAKGQGVMSDGRKSIIDILPKKAKVHAEKKPYGELSLKKRRQVDRIIRQRLNGRTFEEIAKDLKVTIPTVQQTFLQYSKSYGEEVADIAKLKAKKK
jgi:uncharacterized protein (DUF433 family)